MDQDTIAEIAATATSLRLELTERGAGKGEAFSWVTAAMPAIVAYETSVTRYPATETRDAADTGDDWAILRVNPADEPGQLWDTATGTARAPVVLSRGITHARLCNDLGMAGPGELIFRRYVPEEDVIDRRRS